MKFEIMATYCHREVEEIVEKYPILKQYGFEVVEERKVCTRNVKITDENGRPMTQKVPYEYVDKKAYIQINSLEEILDLRKDVDEDIIIYNDSNTIEIYDGYRE